MTLGQDGIECVGGRPGVARADQELVEAAISEGLLALLQPYLRETPGKSRVTLSLISLPEQ